MQTTGAREALPSIDARAFRQTVGQFATGVTVVAAKAGEDVLAMTANAFTALSLDPPLVLFCTGRRTKIGQAIESVAGFTINVLASDQQDLSTYFAGAWTHPERPPFTFIEWEGGPRLDGVVCAIGCALEQVLEGGDHWIVIGRVLALHRMPRACPLVFYGGRYAALGATSDEGMLMSGF